ncbi:MAG TPA: 16S rRNA (cytosine(1402)-N(4))-methyltransferase RsmH [Thermodesulfovibrionales bacterium]|nr:16S rRNA (cytosine(1402)-N(4))-methyltransferase RsmH [Thermodesulfovibrionales bacterium]
MITHLPVMVREVLELLSIRPGGTYVDATVGLGGHAAEILKAVGPDGRLIGIDRDDEALKKAGEILSNDRVVLRKGRFSDLESILLSAHAGEVNGVLFDFGVSMMQFKDMGRGFSFNSDEALDMRMDKSQPLTAEYIVNTYPEKELERILREYGEEGYARKIAKAITMYRMKNRIHNCRELADVVSAVCRRKGRHHPATKTFQALRIAVNDELNEIMGGLEASMGVLKRGGRLCAISYHSLEDRVVKNYIRTAAGKGLVTAITKKPLVPSYEERKNNPSARSAKLRSAEKL